MTLVRNGSETINGSMVWDAASNTLSFVKTGGVLEPGSYEVTLTSSADAFKDTSSNHLDGDGDFVPGGDFVTTFTATNNAVVVSLPDFARGAGQVVEIPAGLPIAVSNATGVTAVDLDVRYDPALLTITGARLPSALPGDWTIGQNQVTPGVLKLTASGTTPLTGTDVVIYTLDAEVPDTAPYGDSQVIRLDNVRVNEEAIASQADFAVHKAVYLGDADGNAVYTGFDAALISRAVVQLDSGFDKHDWTDPVIVSDATGDGTLSGLDASFVAQKAVMLARPEIPDLPGIVTVEVEPGVDPRLSIDLDIPGSPGDPTTVSVALDDTTAVVSATFDVRYDGDVLSTTTPGDVHLGSLWPTADGWSLFSNVVTSGHVRVLLFNAMATTTGQGEITQLNFAVAGGAAAGSTPLDIEPVDPNEGGLAWTESDGSILIDAVGPAVTGVFVRGTNWTSSFLDALESDGLGDATLGFEIETGSSDQAKPLPWSNIDQISIVYSEDVAIDANDVRLAGVNVTDYGFTFSYDASGTTATLTLDAPLGVDKILIDIEDSSPSDNGVAGGNFEFLFTTVVGDVDRNGGVNVLDLINVRNSVVTSEPSGQPAAISESPSSLAAASASEVSGWLLASVMADEGVVVRVGSGSGRGLRGDAWSNPTLAQDDDGDLLAAPPGRTVVVETQRSLAI